MKISNVKNRLTNTLAKKLPIIRSQTLFVLAFVLVVLLSVYIISVGNISSAFDFFAMDELRDFIGIFQHKYNLYFGEQKEGMTDKLYGNTSIVDSTNAIFDVLNSNNSSTVKTLNVKNILLDTKIGSHENLSKADNTFYDNYQNMLNILNDNTLSSDKQLTEINDIINSIKPLSGVAVTH